jgi:acyl-CoA reductase-like NAD-dependent aldehyde dehydrogenase
MVIAGQACVAVQRVYVHRDIYEPFLEKAIRVAQSLKVGDPEDPETDVGPMISEREAIRAETWVQEAVAQGAKIAYGGKREGAVFHPTILVDVNPEMKVMCMELFAPVISIVPYDNIEDAFRQANDSRYGLQVGLFTSNLQLAMQAAHELEFGGIIINDISAFRADNMPYGGLKDSGLGKEGPRYTIEEMTDEKMVVITL